MQQAYQELALLYLLNSATSDTGAGETVSFSEIVKTSSTSDVKTAATEEVYLKKLVILLNCF